MSISIVDLVDWDRPKLNQSHRVLMVARLPKTYISMVVLLLDGKAVCFGGTQSFSIHFAAGTHTLCQFRQH